MVEISMFGSGEGLVWVTGRGYSTTLDLAIVPIRDPEVKLRNALLTSPPPVFRERKEVESQKV